MKNLPRPTLSEVQDLAVSAQIYLLKEVGSSLGSWAVDDIGKAGEDFDIKLCAVAEEFLASVAFPRLTGGRAFQGLSNQFELEEREFEVRIQGDMWSPDTVNVAVISRGLEPPPSRPEPEAVNLRGPGLYHRADLFIPEEFQACKEVVAQIVTKIFSTGYTLLREEIRRCCSDESISAAAIYRRLRVLIADDDLSADVWLVAFEGEEGVYLLDPTIVDSALKRVSSVSGNLGMSPALVVGGLLNVVLPLKVALSRIAIERDECIVVDLNDSQYKAQHPQFLTAEKALYGGREVAILPILREGDKGYFVAVFPASKRAKIEPLLIAHREDLAREFEAFRSRISKLIHRLKEARGVINPQWLGTFTGSTMASALKALLE